jgi:Fe-S oxidoreductase
MVDRATLKAKQLLDALEPLAREGISIVGLEPSCLLTLRDEMLVMGLGEAAKMVSGHAFMLEEFIAHEAKAGRFAVEFEAVEAPVLVHGHCHQKAFGVIAPVMDVLRLIPGAQPTLIESSCCGMAGSFGYEAAHYAASMLMAEAGLLPAVRNAPEAIIVADGTSCRHQILDGTGRQAIHVAELLDRQLRNYCISGPGSPPPASVTNGAP